MRQRPLAWIGGWTLFALAAAVFCSADLCRLVSLVLLAVGLLFCVSFSFLREKSWAVLFFHVCGLVMGAKLLCLCHEFPSYVAYGIRLSFFWFSYGALHFSVFLSGYLDFSPGICAIFVVEGFAVVVI